MPQSVRTHPSVAERRERGKQLRTHAARDSHTSWKPAVDRPDPIGLLKDQDATREADLVPVRHGRMMVLAVHVLPGRREDHGRRPRGQTDGRPDVQLCGDAHLSNFGVFASPERRLLFDLNDFDETLPGRSSTTSNGWRQASRSPPATTASPGRYKGGNTASVTAYREAMTDFAAMGTLDIWYARCRRRRPGRDRLRATAWRRTEDAAGDAESPARTSSRPRRAPATACRHSPSSARSSTANTE